MQTLTNSGTLAQAREKLRSQKWFGCSSFALLLYVGFCLVLAMVSYLRPLPTFDRYLYAGAVASLRYSDPVMIQRIARAEFDTQPSPFVFENVAAEPYFADIYDNPYHFTEQLGLFRVKLGYVASGYVLWRAGLPILTGLRLVSAGLSLYYRFDYFRLDSGCCLILSAAADAAGVEHGTHGNRRSSLYNDNHLRTICTREKTKSIGRQPAHRLYFGEIR
jgi:hypothetical protein